MLKSSSAAVVLLDVIAAIMRGGTNDGGWPEQVIYTLQFYHGRQSGHARTQHVVSCASGRDQVAPEPGPGPV